MHTNVHSAGPILSPAPMSFRSPNRKHDRAYFHKYTSASTAKIVLGNGTIRWSASKLLNDPFDVPKHLHIPFTLEELQDAVYAGFREVMEGRRDTRKPFFAYVRDWFQTMPPDAQRAVMDEVFRDRIPLAERAGQTLLQFQEQWDELAPRTRIFCMSEIADSPTMWAYYAENHSGVVLTFNVLDEIDSAFLLAHPAIYSDKRPSLPPVEVWAHSLVSGVQPNWREWFKEFYYGKRPEWSHEREWRVVTYARDDDTADFMDRPFHPLELRDVRLGLRTPPEVERELLDIVEAKYRHAAVYRSTTQDPDRQLGFTELRMGAWPLDSSATHGQEAT